MLRCVFQRWPISQGKNRVIPRPLAAGIAIFRPAVLFEQVLLEDVRRYPDKLLRERAEDFSMSINGIWVALKRLGIKKERLNIANAVMGSVSSICVN